MAQEKKKKAYRHRSLFSKIVCCLLVIAIAAGVCAYGCFVIILKGPFESYKASFVRHICRETAFGFVVERMIGEEELGELLGPLPESGEAAK
ncbi:MAG: hypothetical protein IJM17_09505 [Firmicutes bacterium]|nr:hypothetical protein [Bacillota bacterium]